MPRVEKEETSRRSSSKSRSTQGWGAVAKRQAEVAEAKEASEGAVRDFWLKAGESAIIQFLQDEPFCYDAHNVKDKRGNWKVVPCQLNTKKHCVMCSEGIKQTWKAGFIILDYRGTWDGDKKRFKNDTQVLKIWRVGATIAQQLKQQVDKRGKDLTEMMFEVSRSGEGKDATYNFEPAFDAKDRKMIPIKYKEEIPDVADLCAPPTDDEIDSMGFSSGSDD